MRITGRRLPCIWTTGSRSVAAEILMRKLMHETICTVVVRGLLGAERWGARGTHCVGARLLRLKMSSVVGVVHEVVGSAVSGVVLLAPDLVLAVLIGIHGLGEC